MSLADALLEANEMPWVYADGGRRAAGYLSDTVGDCACRSIAIVSGKPYLSIYAALNELAKEGRGKWAIGSRARDGVTKITYERLLKRMGFKWALNRTRLRVGELPSRAKLVVRMVGHLTAVVDGVIHDTWDCSGGYVLGWWS